MRTRVGIISLLLALTAFFVVVWVGLFKASQPGYLIAVPRVVGTGASIKALEEVNEDKLPLTYENPYDKNVSALQSNHGVVLKGTNYTYPYVMGYGIISGGFFTKGEQDNKNKVAVMNEKAAFDIFGTVEAAGNEIRIDMVQYEIVGVIDDGDGEGLNIFVPATGLSDSAGDVAANLTDVGGLTEEYVKNELKHIGIDESKYKFLNLDRINRVLEEKTVLSLEIIAAGILLLAARAATTAARGKWSEIKCSGLYVKELFKAKAMPVQKLTLLTAAIVGAAVLEIYIAVDAFGKFLNWYGMKDMFDNVVYTGFAVSIQRAESRYMISNVAFGSFLILFIIFIITVYTKRPDRKQ